MIAAPKTNRPTYSSMTVADALAANWRGWHLSQKMDGIFAVREMHGATFVGEQMPGGGFIAFDVVEIGCQDMRQCPFRERWMALQTFRQSGVRIVSTGNGIEFMEAVIASGGEGMVAANLDAVYADDGARIKIKQQETFDCVVTDTSSGKLSVAIAFNGQPAGRVSIHSLPILDSLNPGDWIEISAMNQHPSGKFREPRFVRTRPDKGGKSE